MQIYFHSRLCSYLSRVPILVEDTVYIYIYINKGASKGSSSDAIDVI